MKIKQDFVTNSSTTSYVMLGYRINFSGDINESEEAKKQLEDLEEKAEKVGYSVFAGDEMGAPDNLSAYIGIVLSEISDSCAFNESEFEVEELISKLEKLRIDLNLSKEQKLKIITTTRMS